MGIAEHIVVEIYRSIILGSDPGSMESISYADFFFKKPACNRQGSNDRGESRRVTPLTQMMLNRLNATSALYNQYNIRLIMLPYIIQC
jgi:hypothetical protein